MAYLPNMPYEIWFVFEYQLKPVFVKKKSYEFVCSYLSKKWHEQRLSKISGIQKDKGIKDIKLIKT